MGLSRRAYARHRGVSESAVRKALAEGRISLEPDGSIDPAKADAAWRSASNPIRPHNAHASESAVPPTATAPVPPAPKRAEPGPHSGRTPGVVPSAVEATRESGEAAVVGGFAQARTVNEVLKAQERRVRLQKQKGELIDRARATATVFALARRERDAWIQWPARAAALIAAELQVDPHRVEQVLEAHVRAHLSELSEIVVELR